MKDNYSNLRRRTRDSSWQWLLMGLILGVGFAAVICVGGYALGGITFPMLEDNTSTPNVQIAPNETEIALQATSIQQTLAAQLPPATTTDTPTEGAAVTNTTPMPTTSEQAGIGPTATPTMLPGTNLTPAPTSPQAVVPLPTAAVDGAAAVSPAPTVQTAALVQETPIVGTPPVGQATQAIGLPGAAIIPPELDTIKTNMVTVDGGTFTMGTTTEEAILAMEECAIYGKTCEDQGMVSDSYPPHQTTVDRFQIEVYEVSLSQFVTFLNWMGPNSHKTRCQGNPCALTSQEDQYSNIVFDGNTYSVRTADFYSSHPATNVTWWGAVEYCDTLNRRLPTEAEWERAARGRENYIYPWGISFDPTRAMSSIDVNKGTVAVDQYLNGASPYGVYNMSGNVEEWVSDWYQSDYYTRQVNNPEPNPKGPAAGTEKVLRGGSWDTIPLFLRAVHRRSTDPGSATAAIGFRCAAEASAATTTAPVNTTTTTGDTQNVQGSAPTLPPVPTVSIPPTPAGTLSPE
ncbi:MAG: SUMF1/EgtB/PvdO family nonheme iron enzyme [Chloroflexi bacterium]|nr:SUMF1/EgtB/PvdO family nonheme iron enzyme [Chloroflexota bacterium]